VNEKQLKRFHEIDSLFSPQQNFLNYRERIQQMMPNTPCIPYLGIFINPVDQQTNINIL